MSGKLGSAQVLTRLSRRSSIWLGRRSVKREGESLAQPIARREWPASQLAGIARASMISEARAVAGCTYGQVADTILTDATFSFMACMSWSADILSLAILSVLGIASIFAMLPVTSTL